MEQEIKLPLYLLQMLENQYNENDVNRIIKGYNEKRKVTFRVNTLKTTKEKICKVLEENKIQYQKVEWSNEAFIIRNVDEEQIKKLEIYNNGEIYLQSLSSMLPSIVLQPGEEEDILDMCAAPGGKTTQMAAITKNKACITACEMSNIRAERLKYNIQKQGAIANIMVTDARNLDDFFSFKKILLDAPCSGSGTININEEILFTQKFADKLEKTQLNLLKKAIKLLKKGNEIVYSTCSILYRENENIINQILKEGNLKVVPIQLEGIEDIPLLPCKIPGALCVCPNELYEGFFVVKLKKE